MFVGPLPPPGPFPEAAPWPQREQRELVCKNSPNTVCNVGVLAPLAEGPWALGRGRHAAVEHVDV